MQTQAYLELLLAAELGPERLFILNNVAALLDEPVQVCALEEHGVCDGHPVVARLIHVVCVCGVRGYSAAPGGRIVVAGKW